MSVQTFPMILRETYMITPNVRHMVFEREDGSHLDFIPGQFISIHFICHDKMIRRSYSIASIPGRSNKIEIALSYFEGGPASEFLFALQPGEIVETSGPYGRLVLRDEHPPRYVFVATGTGVTPYRAMLPELAKRIEANPNLQVVLLLGIQKKEDAIYVPDFLEMANNYPNFDFRVHYSREPTATLLPFERQGYVQTAFDALELQPTEDIIYLCGNPNMIDNAVDYLKEKGFAIQNVRREKYVS